MYGTSARSSTISGLFPGKATIPHAVLSGLLITPQAPPASVFMKARSPRVSPMPCSICRDESSCIPTTTPSAPRTGCWPGYRCAWHAYSCAHCGRARVTKRHRLPDRCRHERALRQRYRCGERTCNPEISQRNAGQVRARARRRTDVRSAHRVRCSHRPRHCRPAPHARRVAAALPGAVRTYSASLPASKSLLAVFSVTLSRVRPFDDPPALKGLRGRSAMATNLLISGLPAPEQTRLAPFFERVELADGEELVHPGQRIDFIWFIERAV